jgi:hypothetical protein
MFESSPRPSAPPLEHAELLEANLRLTRRIAELIAENGDLYGPCVRELVRGLSEDSAANAHALRSLEQLR